MQVVYVIKRKGFYFKVKRAAEAFLVGQLENLTLFSLGQASLTLDVFKDIYQKLSAEKDQMIKDAVSEALQKQTLASEKNPNSTSSVISNTQRYFKRIFKLKKEAMP